jgi:hypothetical protein
MLDSGRWLRILSFELSLDKGAAKPEWANPSISTRDDANARAQRGSIQAESALEGFAKRILGKSVYMFVIGQV